MFPVADRDRHRDAPVDAQVHPFRPVETVEILGREQVEHAMGSRARLRLDVRHPPLAGADRQVEAETVIMQPAVARREGVHRAPLAEDGAAHVAAVREVPDR